MLKLPGNDFSNYLENHCLIVSIISRKMYRSTWNHPSHFIAKSIGLFILLHCFSISEVELQLPKMMILWLTFPRIQPFMIIELSDYMVFTINICCISFLFRSCVLLCMYAHHIYRNHNNDTKILIFPTMQLRPSKCWMKAIEKWHLTLDIRGSS